MQGEGLVQDSPRIPVRLAWWRDARPNGLADLVDAVTKLYDGETRSSLADFPAMGAFVSLLLISYAWKTWRASRG